MTQAPPEIGPWLERPHRADARRNYDLLIAAAREAFAEHGAKASLEDIARRAGVGIGTLYRRFPNRQALLEAVYIGEIRSVCNQAGELATHMPPWDALVTWLRNFVEHFHTRKAIATELVDALGKESPFFELCKTQLRDSAAIILARAQEAGEVRPDVDVMDVLRLIAGIAHINAADPDLEVSYRMLDLVLDGLRAKRD